MRYPIVIPLHHGGGKLKNNTELRYALRSLARHFKDECEVAIVGRRMPEWAQGLRHIESREGLKTALADAAKAYPEGFFWWYDDLCLLKDTTGEEMKVTPACKGWGSPRTGWSRRLDEIRQRLLAEGRPAWDYSRPHGPYWFDQAMVKEGFADWPGMKSKFPWESWILSKRDWPRRYGVVKQYYGSWKGTPGDGAWFVNYNDKGNTGELREWLAGRFPEGCRWEEEKKPQPIQHDQRVQAMVIALPQRSRWEAQCIEDLKPWGIDAAIFPGIDGHDPAHEKVMPVNATAFRKSFKHEPLPGEIGCFSSHIKIAKAAADLPPLHPSLPEWHLVLEDDAVSMDMTADKLCEIANIAQAQGYDLVMLHTGRNNRRGGSDKTALTITKGRDIFTHAYLAKLSAFREMSGWEMRHPIDHAISRSKKLRVAVLWGNSRFDQRPPSTSAQSIHRERKAAYAGKSEIYEAAPQEEFAIPALHQVWIGHAPLPPRLAAYCEGMRAAFPGWSYRLWDERSMRELAENAVLPKVVRGEDVWGRPGLTTGIRADVVRLEILRQHGGVYFDCDYEALRKDLRPLFRGARGFVYSDQRNGQPGNGLLGAAKVHHPLVSLYLRRIAAHLEAPVKSGDVLRQSGPPRLEECLHYWMGHWRNGKLVSHGEERVAMHYEEEDVAAMFSWIAHPYFYQKGTWATFDPAAHPNAWAAHHWSETWKPQAASTASLAAGFTLPDDPWMANALTKESGEFDGDSLRTALSFVPKWNFAIDGGAHVGTWTRPLASRFEKVLAFEPHAANRHCLVQNVSFSDRVEIRNEALGFEEGESAMEAGRTNSGEWHLVDGKGTKVIPLDSIDLPAVDFLKLDLEGFELAALQGAEGTIKASMPIILIEENGLCERYGVRRGDATRWLNDRGYECCAKVRNDLIFRPTVNRREPG